MYETLGKKKDIPKSKLRMLVERRFATLSYRQKYCTSLNGCYNKNVTLVLELAVVFKISTMTNRHVNQNNINRLVKNNQIGN